MPIDEIKEIARDISCNSMTFGDVVRHTCGFYKNPFGVFEIIFDPCFEHVDFISRKKEMWLRHRVNALDFRYWSSDPYHFAHLRERLKNEFDGRAENFFKIIYEAWAVVKKRNRDMFMSYYGRASEVSDAD
jgi:hypothetical protein